MNDQKPLPNAPHLNDKFNTVNSATAPAPVPASTIAVGADDIPLIQFLNNLLLDAVQKGISDLHFEPYENYYRLRARQDGILYETAMLPVKLGPQLSSRLKILSNLDISERRLPQDGRFKISEFSSKNIRGNISNNTKYNPSNTTNNTMSNTTNNTMGNTASNINNTRGGNANHNIGNTTRNNANNPINQNINKNSASDLSQVDFRMSSCPTLFGEKIVIRILDPKQTQFDIDSLGMEPFQKELLLNHLSKPQGMILVTGPTGSGKTFSLYTALHLLNTPQRNILSCEDPVEIYLPGINQVNINLKAGLFFANTLRAFLRQDPDIIMLGEIRDLETAEIAIKAAQTGHLVLSTLHTNSAAETINRLMHMGIANFNLASSLSLMIAQRLARRLCQYCKVPQELPASVLITMGFLPEEIAEISLFAPKGCDNCKNGYRGRVGIYELLCISPTIQMAILNGAHAIELQNKAELEGMWTLKKAALNKVKQGVTSLEEIQRVIMA